MDQISNIERPRRVDLGAIEAELRGLWREANADPEHPAVRASLLSLIAVVEPGERETVSDLAAEVALRHPCRIIIMVIDPDSAVDEVAAEVSARCHLSFGMRKQVCSEQIIITASGKSAAELHALVAPLLTSDLPAVLWWRASRRPEPHSFKLLTDLCSRVILDSAILLDAIGDIGGLDGLIRSLAGVRPVGDLLWSRLTPWRAALASLFDVPVYRRDLDRISRITIEYAAGSASPRARNSERTPNSELPTSPTALLLAGWLASRLGWIPGRAERDGESACAVKFTAGDTEVQIKFSAVREGRPEARPLSIQRVELICPAQIERNESVFSIRLSGGCIETTATIAGEQHLGRVIGSGDRSEADLLGEELDIMGRDAIYEEALSMAARIAGLPGY
jgi:glucose-6-phosphate dehydrogenase assembly protein OpcA